MRTAVVAAIICVILIVIGATANPSKTTVTIRDRQPQTIIKVVKVMDTQAPAAIEGCPTEDSCRIDYHDGTWYVTPQVP